MFVSVLLIVVISVGLFLCSSMLDVLFVLVWLVVVIFSFVLGLCLWKLRYDSELLIVVLMCFDVSRLIDLLKFCIGIMLVLCVVVSLLKLLVSVFVDFLFFRLLNEWIVVLFVCMISIVCDVMYGVEKLYFVLCVLVIDILLMIVL